MPPQIDLSKCVICEKTVYHVELITANGVPYHKTCFRCTHCNNLLKLGNFAALEGKIYCKPHFKQLFALKGNYSDSFSGSSTPSHSAHGSAAASPKAADSSSPTRGEADDGKASPSEDGERRTSLPMKGSIGLRMKAFQGASAETEGSPVKSPSASEGGSTRSPQRVLSPNKFGTTDKCVVCNKTVYAMEKISADIQGVSSIYHKNCFRCTEGCLLTAGNFAAVEGKLYCKPHFKQAFKKFGSYAKMGSASDSPSVLSPSASEAQLADAAEKLTVQ
eukprot:jgi/Mesvir1/26099/Mv06818-RA.1